MTAGTFRAVTGLSKKALRLYAERGLLAPIAVQPASGYRLYDTEQVRAGIVLDILRRARVPMSDLAPEGFPYEEWRTRLTVQRAMEDFYLSVAELVDHGDPSSFAVDTAAEPAAHFIATSCRLESIKDADDMMGLFASMAGELPLNDRTLLEVLRHRGMDVLPESWTAIAGDEDAPRMLVAHRTRERVDGALRDRIASDLAERLSEAPGVVTGTLPDRRELTFAPPARTAYDETGATEIADDYLRVAAFADHIRRTGLTALSMTPRRRVKEPSMFDGTESETVFDVAL